MKRTRGQIGLAWMVIMCILPLAATAQTNKDIVADYLQRAGDHAALYRGRLYTNSDQTGWAVHPYWEDDAFHPGTVGYRGLEYQGVMLRLDIYRNELQVVAPQSNQVVIPNQEAVEYFTMEGMRYVHGPEGRWAQEVYGGKHTQLVRCRQKVGDRQVEMDGVALNNLKVTEHLVVMDQMGGQREVKNLKGLKKQYPQYAEALDELSRKNNLSFNGIKREESLSRCVAQVDQMMPDVANPEASQMVQQIPDSLFHRVWNREIPVYGQTHTPDPTTSTETTRQDAGFVEISPEEELEMLDEITITAFHSKLNLAQTGMEKFSPQQLRNIPMSMGEADIVKMVQMLPGVSSMGEASSGYNVRGGASDQNLMLMGGNTLYNPMHMFGLFSAVNTDAVTDVELYKSGIPSRYGGRISSVLNMQNKIASMKQWAGQASVGLLTSKGQLEIPLVKDHLSLMVAGRTTYSDWMLKLLPEKSGYKDGRAGFYDLNSGLAWTPNERHLIHLTGYYSHDRFSFTHNDRYGYSNGNGSVRWKAYWNDQLTSTLQMGIDHYDYSRTDQEKPTLAARLSFRIHQGFLNGLFERKAGEKHQLKWGWNTILYNVAPGRYAPVGEESTVALDELQHQSALEAALHVEDEWKPTERWRINMGARYSLFTSKLQGKSKAYQSPELRLSTSYTLPHHQQLKLGWNNMAQFIHKVSNTVIMSPTDTWTLSGQGVAPQRGWQATAGYVWESDNRVYEISAEVYYKRLSNYLTYDNAAILLMNHQLADDMRSVQGQAYGVELQVKKNTGKLTGWISYTYARTRLRDTEGEMLWRINGGQWYAADMDRPHEVNVVGNYKITRRYSFSGNLDYSTGRPTTIPTGMYYDYQRLQFLPTYSERNGYRLPYNLRLDVSFNIEPGHHLTNRTHSWFSIGCYNVTARRNVYSLYYQTVRDHIQGYRLSIFGAPIPYISYNIKF